MERQRRVALFGLEAAGGLAQAVAKALGEPLVPHEERIFEDGEHKGRPLESVRGADAYVLTSLHGDGTHTVNDKLVRLLFFVGALKDAGAARVTAVVPYLAYARKDQRSKPRDPVASRYVAMLFEAMHVDAVVALDVHNLAAFQNAFRCRTEHLEARPELVAHFVGVVRARAAVVVSPDIGGIKRAEAFRATLAAALGRDVGSGFVEKHRSDGRVFGDGFAGDVRERVAIIVDDMISAGTTMARAASACRDAGAIEIHAAATHAVFAPGVDDTLGSAPLQSVVVTDTIGEVRPPSAALRDRLVRLSIAPLIAQAIERLAADGSIVELSQRSN